MNRENPALQDILAYEKQLLADREQLHNLLEQYQVEEDAIVRDKLRFFQSELKHMNHQYELLKKKTEVAQSTDNSVDKQIPPILTQTTHTSPNVQNLTQNNSAAYIYPNPKTIATQYDSQRPSDEQPSSPSTQKQFTGIEKMVGSSLMGILASALIFISLILFATVIMPYLGQAFKLTACYLISFIMIGVSLFRLRKNKQNKFFLALAGCGTGALYITLLLTNIYFRYIGDIPLFVLITVWVGFVCYLSRTRNLIFQTIGHIGVTISLTFGAILCVRTGNTAKLLSLIIFYIISFGTLYITHFNREVAYTKIGNTFGCVNLFILFFAGDAFSGSVFDLIFITIAVIHLTVLFAQTWEKSYISYGVFLSLFGILIALNIFRFFGQDYNTVNGILTYLIAMAIIFLTEFKPKAHPNGMVFSQISMVLQACMGLAFHEAAFKHGFVWLIILPVMLLGFFRSNTTAKYGSLVLTAFYLFQYIPDTERFIMGLLVVCALYALCWFKKEETTHNFKIVLHLLGVVLFLYTGWDVLDNYIERQTIVVPIVFIVLSLYNIVLSKSPFRNNLLTGEPEPLTHYNILNVILMLAALVIIERDTPLHIPVILIALGLFFQNSGNLLRMYHNMLAGIYVGLKFTVLIYVILDSFHAVNYIISSAFLLFSVACIIIGFIKEYKSLRVYGLILSMISVFKLVMLDIRYENTLGNALSFFVSGILCFAISMIYNYIDKKIINEKED